MTAAKARRSRGTGFPIVPLPEAVGIIREAGKYGFEHSVSAFARYVGHSTTNSSAFRQRLAAFRDWNLVTGRGDTVAFTDTARTIALPRDATAEQAALMNCAVFVSLYERVSKGQKVDAQRLGAIAVHDLGVSRTSSDRFTASFVASAVAAGLARDADDGRLILLDLEHVEQDDALLVPAGDDGEDHTPRPIAAPRAQPVIRQEWEVTGGSVLIELRLDRPLPASLFSAVGAVVKEAEALAKALGEHAAGRADG